MTLRNRGEPAGSSKVAAPMMAERCGAPIGKIPAPQSHHRSTIGCLTLGEQAVSGSAERRLHGLIVSLTCSDPPRVTKG